MMLLLTTTKSTTKLMTILLCFLIKFVIATTAANDQILNGHGDDERGLEDERCKREILCTEKDLNGPKICGTNGKTYSNPCELNRIVCFGLPVEMHRMGDCQITERCPLEREFQLKLIRSNSIKYANEFVPICDKITKLYAHIQCHSVIGYCWCSTNHGSPIPSTSVAINTHKMPDCHHLNAIHVGADGKIQKVEHLTTNATECGNVERIIFNSNILDVYRREYDNVPGEHSPHQGDEPGETLEREILVWRFNKLDIDGNGRLSGDELASERRLTVLIVKPTACARSFHKFCDKNSDRLIDLQEWTTCLKIDFGTNVLPEPNDDNALPIYELPSKSLPPTVASSSHSHEDDPSAFFLESITKKADTQMTMEKPNCRLDREKVISSVEPQYLDTIFIPRCTGDSDKFYIEIQCHQKPARKFCWCVHPITGEPTGSSLVTTIDECKKASRKKLPHKIGSIKGCLPNKELLFYRKLFGILSKEMREKSPLNPTGPKRRRPQVAKWKFAMLDSNGNSEIERNEWKEFRTMLRQLKNVRKCGRNFIRFCDINKDGRISRREWMTCTVHAYRHAKSFKPNPFLTMLKSVD